MTVTGFLGDLSIWEVRCCSRQHRWGGDKVEQGEADSVGLEHRCAHTGKILELLWKVWADKAD